MAATLKYVLLLLCMAIYIEVSVGQWEVIRRRDDDVYNDWEVRDTGDAVDHSCCCCSDPCLNSGTCVPTNNGSSFWCECQPGFTGYQCRIPVVPTDQIGDCEDGPRLEIVPIGSTIVGDCSNTESYYDAYCQGSCSAKQKCYPIMFGEMTVDMAKQDGTPCPQEVVPIIGECNCSAEPIWPLDPPAKPEDCKLVSTEYERAAYGRTAIDGNRCTNRKRFTLGSCRGGCSDDKKCQGTYETIFVTMICRSSTKKVDRFVRTFVSATDCNCG